MKTNGHRCCVYCSFRLLEDFIETVLMNEDFARFVESALNRPTGSLRNSDWSLTSDSEFRDSYL